MSKKRTEKPAPLSRARIEQLTVDLAFHELEAENARKQLIRHYREGLRKGQSWLLRGLEWDVLLTRAGVVSIPSQEGVRKLDTRVAKQWFARIFVPLDHTKAARRASPGDLPKRILKLLKLSRHWRVKPESRPTSSVKPTASKKAA